MIFKLKLSKSQYRYFASALKTFSGGILLGSSAAFFLPETLQLKESISITRYIALVFAGLISIVIGAILEQRGENNDRSK